MATRQAASTKQASHQPTLTTGNGRSNKPAAKRQPQDTTMAGLEQTSIDLKQDVRQQVVRVLNQQLADTFDLFSHTKQAHWNVKGRDFYQLHLLFDTLAEGLEDHIDEIAERVTALGGEAQGTVRLAASSTRLPEYLPGAASGMTHVEALVERYANLAASTREASQKCEELEDMSTSDLFNDVSRDLDKWLWFLEAHRQTVENDNQ
jgi:starvation-inducible DNA-binding protein